MTKKPHILVVEDEEPLLLGIRDMLEVEGYEVTLATDGEEALHLLQSMTSHPDLIISDIRMPNLDGYGFLEAVRGFQEYVSVPFIFLSAKGDKEDVRMGRLRGADDYVPKPFDYEDLLVSVKSCISRQRQIRAVQESRMATLRRRILDMLNHEFRTPLNSVLAYTEMMADAPLEPEKLREYISGLREGSIRLHRLIERFLMLAELESGHGAKVYTLRKRRLEHFDELVCDVVDRLQEEAQDRGVRLEMIVEPPICSLIGHPDYLLAAIRHLVENAIKFSPEDTGALVECRLFEQDGYVIFSVTDQGIGIPREDQDQLFEMFYQVNRHQYEQQGIGAGLAIARHVARLHGGDTRVESEPGQGSCFELILPCE
ncbi:MAG: response regulator [Anaerolineae bacterium]